MGTGTITLDRKDYPDTGLFKQEYIQEYCNLEIYPLVANLEIEAGILNDFAEYLNNPVFLHHYSGIRETCMYLEDHIYFNKESATGTVLARIDESYTGNLMGISYDIVLSVKNSILDSRYRYSYKVADKVLYISSKYLNDLFMDSFKYYFINGEFNYSNLICYCMIVKNAAPVIEQVLMDNKPYFDRWCILDTGSTDGTQDIIRRCLVDKKGSLFEEPFINFRESRNRCLELAGKVTKFIIMLDDTYSLVGNLREFLTTIRGDQFSDSFSPMIKSADSEYFSNRIIKSTHNLKYIYTIHEVIQKDNNVNVCVPNHKAYILDLRSDYMEKRTNDRKTLDLELLFKEYSDNPDDPRSLYYLAQTYACLGDSEKKTEYFLKRINHPNEGFYQEKLDACFELARIYNFELLKDWSECMKYYLMAYNMDTRRPDSLYFIGIHYYFEKNYPEAYKYFLKCFHLGYPTDSQYSLKPTITYRYGPRYLAEMCYYQKDFVTGEACSQLFLNNNKPCDEFWNMMSSWNSIFKNLNKLPKLNNNPLDSQQVFCILADGGWTNWTGSDILTKGVGGSETWVIETGSNLKKLLPGYRIIVFCRTDRIDLFEGVEYTPIDSFFNFIANYVVEYCIISRYSDYIPAVINSHVKNIGVIFHDTFINETIIPINEKLKWVFCLSDWHSNLFKNMFPAFESITHTQNYGIDLSKFKSIPKVKNSFIYSSFPNRGLSVLLKMWPRIVSKFPDAVLNIYSNVDGEWVNQIAPEEMKEIKTLLKINKTGIRYHGWVSKETLSRAWDSAEYFLYPCTFEETFCLTAFEAAASKTLVISNNLAALAETVGNRGIIVPGNPRDLEWQNEILNKLFDVIGNNTDPYNLICENFSYVATRSWKQQTEYLISKMDLSVLEQVIINDSLLELNDGGMLNWTHDKPPDTRNDFYQILKMLPENSNILEIGTYAGISIIEMLKVVKGSRATVIDTWVSYQEHDNILNKTTPTQDISQNNIYELFKNNLKIANVQDRVLILQGDSIDKLLQIVSRRELFDFIYIDASHKCLDCYVDSVLAWKLLKVGGIMAFDDVPFNRGDILNSPYEAVKHFMDKYSNSIEVLKTNYRVFIQKTH